jgi:hypothetical protein
MATGQSTRSCADLKRKIAELGRVRSQMRLDIMRMQTEPGHEEDLADTENTLVLLEDELRELVRLCEEGCTS